MNKLAVSLVNKASWLRFPIRAFHCVVSWGFVEFFSPPSCVWPKHMMHPVISLKRHRNAHRNAPQCLLTLVTAPLSQMLTKTFCWGSLGSLRGETRGAMRLSCRISRHYRPEWKLGALLLRAASWPGYLIWILKSISAVFRLFSFFFSPLEITSPSIRLNGERSLGVFFFFPPLFSLSSPSGGPWDVLVPPLVVRCDSRVHSARNWLQLVQLCWFSLVSHAEQSFRCAQRHPRETAAKQKPINQQRPWMKGSTADNTRHIP